MMNEALMPYRFRIGPIELAMILAIVAMVFAAFLSYALSMTDLMPHVVEK